MLLLARQCTMPTRLTFIDGLQVPFASDCPETSRGRLSVRGVLKNGTSFFIVSSNLTAAQRVEGEKTVIYFQYDLLAEMAKAPYAFSHANVAHMHVYANATIGKTSRVVSVQWEHSCRYGAQLADSSLHERFRKQYLIFPLAYECRAFNFSYTPPAIYIRRFGIAQEDYQGQSAQNGYYLSFDIIIDKNVESNLTLNAQANAYVQGIRLVVSFQQMSISIDTVISRNLDEVQEAYAFGLSAAYLQYEHCAAATYPDNLNISYNSTHVAVAFKNYAICYLNLKIYVINGAYAHVMQLVQSPYFYPYFVLTLPAAMNVDALDIYEYKPYMTDTTLTQPDKTLIRQIRRGDAKKLISGPCNESEQLYYVEKPDFKSMATIRRSYEVDAAGAFQYNQNICSDMRATNVRLPASLVARTIAAFNDTDFYSLPDVYLTREAQHQLIYFYFDDEWLCFEQDPRIYLKFDLLQEVPFKTPALISNCLYAALFAFIKDGQLYLISRYTCEGAATLIKGFTFLRYYNCKNLSSEDYFDMYVCTFYAENTHQRLLSSNLTDFYFFEREYTSPVEEIQPHEFVTQEEYQEQMAQLAQYETNNYGFMDWVASSWWIFFLTFGFAVLATVWIMYGCGVPCKYILVSKDQRLASTKTIEGSFRMMV